MTAIAALPPLALVMFGGAIGAGLRWSAGEWAVRTLGTGLPFATWGVNILGALCMGLLVGWLTGRDDADPVRLLLGVGVLGGFTTFSAFSLEIVEMIVRGDVVLGAAYAVSSVAGSVLALFAGLFLMRA
jgi:CrcB protein